MQGGFDAEPFLRADGLVSTVDDAATPGGRVAAGPRAGRRHEAASTATSARLASAPRRAPRERVALLVSGAPAPAQSAAAGTSTSRLPLMPIGDTSPAASICSTRRAARL